MQAKTSMPMLTVFAKVLIPFRLYTPCEQDFSCHMQPHCAFSQPANMNDLKYFEEKKLVVCEQS